MILVYTIPICIVEQWVAVPVAKRGQANRYWGVSGIHIGGAQLCSQPCGLQLLRSGLQLCWQLGVHPVIAVFGSQTVSKIVLRVSWSGSPPTISASGASRTLPTGHCLAMTQGKAAPSGATQSLPAQQ